MITRRPARRPRLACCARLLTLAAVTRGAAAQSVDTNVVTASADAFGVGPYGTSGFDLDAHAPLAGGRCGVGGGVTRRFDEFVPEVTQFTTDVGILASCQAASGSGGTVFYGRTTQTQQSVMPTVYLSSAPLPEPVEARGTAPVWARGTVVMTDYGGLFKLEMPAHWTLRTGLFRSVFDQPNAGSDLMLDPDTIPVSGLQGWRTRCIGVMSSTLPRGWNRCATSAPSASRRLYR
jgi:hypothetical protein